MVSVAKTSAVGMLEILDDILDLAKIDAEKMELDMFEVPVRTLARGVLEALSVRVKGKAIELMLTGRMMDAQEALQSGLVNYIIETDELLTKAREMLGIIGEKAPLAIAKIIECVNLAEEGGVGDGFLSEQEAFGECFATEDMKEGASAFLEKRKPRFKGK